MSPPKPLRLPPETMAAITAMRVRGEALSWYTRPRRKQIAPRGSLVLVAADHPARRVLAAGEEPLAMADRADFLGRIWRSLAVPGVDGVLGSIDVLEDLIAVDRLHTEAGAASRLEERVLVVSLNRGGLAGASWELDDPPTGPSPEAIARVHLDAGKLLLRLCDDEPRSLRTLERVAEAVSGLARRGLTAFVEPLPVRQDAKGRWQTVLEPRRLAATVGVAQALGETSARTWLKLPSCRDFDRVAAATTLPILMLGGESNGTLAERLDELAAARAAGPNVVGALLGRSLLYPSEGDPAAAAAAVAALFHDRVEASEALRRGQAVAEEIDRCA